MDKKSDLGMLGIGLLIVFATIAIAHFDPRTYASTSTAMQALTAVGAALVGASIPGMLNIQVMGVRAAGALALVVLFFLIKPGSVGPSPDMPSAQTSASSKPTDESKPPPNPTPANPSVPVDTKPAILRAAGTQPDDHKPSGAGEAQPGAGQGTTYTNHIECRGPNCDQHGIVINQQHGSE